MDAKSRFYEVRDALGLTDYRIYTDVEGVTKNMLDRLRQGLTSEVSNKWLIPFLEEYPQVNANYILTGRPPMFLTDHESDIVDNSPRRIESLKTEICERDSRIEVLSEKNKDLENSLNKVLEDYSVLEKEYRGLAFNFEEYKKTQMNSISAKFYKDESEFYREKFSAALAQIRVLEEALMSAKREATELKIQLSAENSKGEECSQGV